MINEETKRKLRELGIGETVAALEVQQSDRTFFSLSFDERFQMVVDYLYQEKYNGKIQRLIKHAKLRIPNADMTGVQYDGRQLNKSLLLELSTCQFVERSTNVVLQGFTGSGKTYLACALAKQACKLRISTCYVRLPDLLLEFDELKLIAKSAGKLIQKFSRYGLLVIDEWLLDDISDDERHLILEIIERRHDTASTIFCTQFKQGEWHGKLGGGVHADAIMDRIVHNAVWLETGAVNMREYAAGNLREH